MITQPESTQPVNTIFTPFSIESKRLKNRLVALPVYTGYAHPDGGVSSLMIEHYTRLAKSGVAMVVVANASVSPEGVLSAYNLRVDRDEFIPGLSKLARIIKQGGALSCLQLNHAGRFARTEQPLMPSSIPSAHLAFNIASLKNFMKYFPFEQRFGLTGQFLKLAGKWGRAMNAVDIENIVINFGKAAFRASEAGFDMVEIHGANGYLICQFLSSFTNRNTSEIKDNFQARVAAPIAVVREIKKRVPNDFPVGFRLILREWVPGGVDIDEAVAFAKLLEEEGVAYLSASVGSYNSIFTSYALTTMSRPGYLYEDLKTLSGHVRIPTIISGRIVNPAIAEKILQDRAADLIGLGRPLRADFDWVKKACAKTGGEISCINCNWCLKRVVVGRGFTCSRWSGSLRKRTDLKHKLLTRSDKGLWVVTDKGDMDLYKATLSRIIPESGQTASIPATILFLKDKDKNSFSDEDQQDFVRWRQDLFERLGFDDAVSHETISARRHNFGKIVHFVIDRGNYGVILIGRNRTHKWQERLLYQERGKVMALIGSMNRYSNILVPVDLSDISLLVLMSLHRIVSEKNKSNIRFLHVLNGTEESAKKKWRKMNRIVGFEDVKPLQLIPRSRKIAPLLTKAIQEGGYGIVIMGKRGLSGVKRRMLGSVSVGVLNGLTNQTLFLVD
ncbi:universal stress protein [Thermodesulfobacteriota bacterium]